MTLVQRLRLRWRRFSPLEERLFAAARGVLPAAAVPVFDAQVGAITHAQRLPGWTEIDYYARRLGRVDWRDVPAFARRDEFALARVRFAVQGRRYRAVLHCVAGHVFDLGITPSPERVAFADWDAGSDAELLSDPMARDGVVVVPDLPGAWRAAVAEVGGQAAAAGWTLHDAATATRVTLDEGEFLVLAEREGDEFVLHRLEPPSEVVFRLASHEGVPEPVRGALGDVLRRPRPAP